MDTLTSMQYLHGSARTHDEARQNASTIRREACVFIFYRWFFAKMGGILKSQRNRHKTSWQSHHLLLFAEWIQLHTRERERERRRSQNNSKLISPLLFPWCIWSQWISLSSALYLVHFTVLFQFTCSPIPPHHSLLSHYYSLHVIYLHTPPKLPPLDLRKYVVHCKKSPYDVYIGRPNPTVKAKGVVIVVCDAFPVVVEYPT